MRPILATICLGVLLTGSPLFGQSLKSDQQFGLTQNDWPWWRGPNRDGSQMDGKEVPLEWSET